MIGNLFHYTCQFAQEGIFLCYSGPTSHDVLVSTGNSLRQYLEENSVDKKRYYCIFSVYVELFENIIRYGVDCFGENLCQKRCRCPYGIITVGMNNDHFTIKSGNIIALEQKDKLKKYLNTIKAMDPQILRDYYRDKRKQTTASDCKGAGLGFIEIIRKSSQPITFSFDYIDDYFLFFSMTTVI
jgi:microcompartment protein CcmK/EutM